MISFEWTPNVNAIHDLRYTEQWKSFRKCDAWSTLPLPKIVIGTHKCFMFSPVLRWKETYCMPLIFRLFYGRLPLTRKQPLKHFPDTHRVIECQINTAISIHHDAMLSIRRCCTAHILWCDTYKIHRILWKIAIRLKMCTFSALTNNNNNTFFGMSGFRWR